MSSGSPTIRWKSSGTPVFLRAYGGAFLDAPGPLDQGQSSHFFITPPDADATPETIESYLREDNHRMLSLLCIHEGVPGHYLQLAWSNRAPSLVRTIFSNGMFAEGWAVYVVQVLLDLGYGADDPALLLTHWKFYLRASRTRSWTSRPMPGMSEEAAMDLMVGRPSRRRTSACAKWLRARITATSGDRPRGRGGDVRPGDGGAPAGCAAAVGADPASVPERRIGPGPGRRRGSATGSTWRR